MASNDGANIWMFITKEFQVLIDLRTLGFVLRQNADMIRIHMQIIDHVQKDADLESQLEITNVSKIQSLILSKKFHL